jgi:hypothetical protein
MLPSSQHSGGRRACLSSKMGLGWVISKSTNQTKPQVGQCIIGTLLMHRWATSKHKLTRLTTTWNTTLPLIIFFMPNHMAHPNVILSWDSQIGVPKFPKLRFLQLWRPIILFSNLWLKWGLKQSCSHHQKLFNNMWHVTCTWGNHGDS